jgi:VWFA-related protein
VIVCQTDFGRIRAKGQMSLISEAGPFLEALLPTDRVAVVSFDSHLKLRQDFTSDRVLIKDAMERSLLIEKVEPWEGGAFPSLGAGLDPVESRKAASIDRSLELIAKALKPFPGPKAILFLGWGLAVNHSPREGRELGRALAALLDARVHVFTLDVSQADFHSLEVGLMSLSEATGGTYQKTHVFSGGLERVQRHLEGRYQLVFEKPALGYTGYHKIEVELVGRKGRVLSRPGYED